MPGTSHHTNTIIIGAGAAGLSCAACLAHYGLPYALIEKRSGVGNEWADRYDRLHLHTTKMNSQLPYAGMPAHYSKYVSKSDYKLYLEQYAKRFAIAPKFDEEVTSVQQQGGHWFVSTTASDYVSKNVIVATGYARRPVSRNCTASSTSKVSLFTAHSTKTDRTTETKKYSL